MSLMFSEEEASEGPDGRGRLRFGGRTLLQHLGELMAYYGLTTGSRGHLCYGLAKATSFSGR